MHSHTSVVFSPSLGVFLGFDGYQSQWTQISSPRGSERAPLFTEMPVGLFQQNDSTIPGDAKLLPVASPNGLYATREDCEEAGISGWGDRFEEVLAERDALLRANADLTRALTHLVDSSVEEETAAPRSPSWAAIMDAKETLHRSERMLETMHASLDFSDTVPLETERIRVTNSELLIAICRTLDELRETELHKIPGLYEALPWAEIQAIRTGSDNQRAKEKGIGTPLTDVQLAIAAHFDGGMYSHVTTLEQVKALEANDQARFFAFLVEEAGSRLEEVEIFDVIEHVEDIEASAGRLAAGLRDAHSNGMRG